MSGRPVPAPSGQSGRAAPTIPTATNAEHPRPIASPGVPLGEAAAARLREGSRVAGAVRAASSISESDWPSEPLGRGFVQLTAFVELLRFFRRPRDSVSARVPSPLWGTRPAEFPIGGPRKGVMRPSARSAATTLATRLIPDQATAQLSVPVGDLQAQVQGEPAYRPPSSRHRDRRAASWSRHRSAHFASSVQPECS